MDGGQSPVQPRSSRFRTVLALSATFAVAVFGIGLTSCGHSSAQCPSENADCRDPSDFTTSLTGSLVLELDGWPDASKVSRRDGSGSRWEYSVTVDEVLYRSPTVDDVATGSTTLVTPVSAGGSPSWNTEVAGPAYVVADRATGSSGPEEDGDLVVKGVFDENLNVVGAPGKTTNLQGFIAWLETGSKHYDPPSAFLVEWVRSFNEGIHPDGSHPMQDLWLEYQSPGPDPERNLDPASADPEVAEELKMVRLGLDSSELTGTDGFIAVFSDRGQLATMPTGHSISSSFVWVLPDEQLKVQLLEEYGAVSIGLGTVLESGLGESLMDATVHVSGTPEAPVVELRDGPVELDESSAAVETLLPAVPTSEG